MDTAHLASKLPTHLQAYQPTNLLTYQPTNLPSYQPTNFSRVEQFLKLPKHPTNLQAYQPFDLPTSQLTNLPTYQPNNLPTYPNNLTTYQLGLGWTVLKKCEIILQTYWPTNWDWVIQFLKSAKEALKSGRQVEMTTCPLRKFIRIAHSLNLKAFVDTPYDTLKIRRLETYLTS